MNTSSTPRRVLLGLALIVGLAGLSAALLHTPSASAKGGKKAAHAQKAARHGGFFKAAADYIGVTPKQLLTELRQGEGKSLAEVAVAHGKTRAGLKQALKSSISEKIQASKRLSAEQKAKAIAGLDAWLDKVVDFKAGKRARPDRGAGKVGHHGGFLKPVADYVGLTPQQLATKLRDGQSLAQIAVAQGKTVAGLKQAIRTPFVARLDKLVDAKRITPAQRDQILKRFDEHLDKLVNRTFKPRR
jgi:hypothetical protein